MNDADIEMARLVELGHRSWQLKKRGICSHGWNQTREDGTVECLHCQTVFPSFADLVEAHREILS